MRICGNVVGSAQEQLYILQDQAGVRVAAVVTDKTVTVDATENDIRAGKTAATEKGVTEGTKEIPSYQTTEGKVRIAPGRTLSIPMFTDKCHYTRLQALVCDYNTNSNDSVATVMVVIGDNVYEVRSTDVKSTVTVDSDSQTIHLGITNDSENYLVIRYFTYKED